MLTDLEHFKDKIVQVYDRLYDATLNYERSSNVLDDIKATLETKKAEGLASGSIEGKNAELREASARQVLPSIYEAVERAEIDARAARLSMTLASIEVERTRALLRVLEIEAKATNEHD